VTRRHVRNPTYGTRSGLRCQCNHSDKIVAWADATFALTTKLKIEVESTGESLAFAAVTSG
jgi:hypothetical protein